VEAKEALLVQRARDREVREAVESGRNGSADPLPSTPAKDDPDKSTPEAGPASKTHVQHVREEYGEF